MNRMSKEGDRDPFVGDPYIDKGVGNEQRRE